MRDSLDDVELDQLTPGARAGVASSSSSAAQQVRRALRGKHVCPFCGTQRETDMGPCAHCSLEDSPTTRSATRSKLGPWYVLQSRNPSAPGMNFATLMALVQKGRVTARSVLRGPTTGQFWRHAAKVKGVSREFGLCWNCGGDVARNARACAHCKRLQEPPLNPNVLLESAEYSADELAEAMWADESPESSQMPASPAAAQAPPPSPQSRPSPADHLTPRAPVRREVPTPISASSSPSTGRFTSPVGPPTSSSRASLSPSRPPVQAIDADHLAGPAGAVEMAVFQRAHASGRRGGVMGKVFKSLLVALLLAVAGVILMSSFDPTFRKRMIEIVDKGQTLWKEKVGGLGGSGNTGTPAGAAAAAANDELPLTPEGAKMKAWELWKTGVDAEQRGDFTGAAKAWEAIKKLSVPEDELPLGLEGRLAAAKKKIK